MTCTATGAAVAGPVREHRARSRAVDPFGTAVSDTDPSHYFGAAPGIDIEKATNGADADIAPGPFIPVGEPGHLDLRRDEHRQRAAHRRRRSPTTSGVTGHLPGDDDARRPASR